MGYAALKTPEADGASVEPVLHTTGASTKVMAVRFVATLGVAGFIFGNIATWAPLFELQLVNTMMNWWNGYPGMNHASSGGHMSMIMDTGVGRNITVSGHTEMVRPTFLLIFCIFPFLVSVLAVEYLRHINTARRLTATAVWRVAMLFRRKLWWPYWGVSKFTVGEWVVGVVYVLGGNALCFWYEWDRRIDSANASNALTTTKYWNIIGISTAYLCVYNMAFLLLPVTHNSAWMEFFNVSHANGVKFHRWIGFMTVLTGEIHMLGYWVKWVRDGTWMVNQLPCLHCDFSLDNSGGGYYAWFNFFGFIADLALLLIIPTSLPIVRRHVYEWFLVSHWTLFVIAIIFTILHWAQIIWWLLPAGLIWFVSRAASQWTALKPVPVQELTVLGEAGVDEIVKVVVKRAAPGTSPMAPSFDFKVGNYVYLNVPSLSKFQWHPLTIASSPKSSDTHLTLLVKPLGDWSSQLAAYAKKCNEDATTPEVYMDGYFGSSLESYEDYPTLALVGGGIGVTPLLAILEDLAADVAANGGAWTQRVEFVLSFREISLLQVVAPIVARLRELDPQGRFFATHLFASTDYSESFQELKLKRTNAKAPARQSPKAQPFYEPLRSSNGLRALLFLSLFVIASFVVAAARWGNGPIQGADRFYLWPVERLFELCVFCATIVIVFGFIWYEQASFQKHNGSQTESEATDVELTPKAVGVDWDASLWSDIHSVGDLLGQLDVAVGQRPDMLALLGDIVSTHKSRTAQSPAQHLLPAVGVIVSGPHGLKMATNEAIVALGAADFDVHEEEFEL